jgi:hypothetical protein
MRAEGKGNEKRITVSIRREKKKGPGDGNVHLDAT